MDRGGEKNLNPYDTHAIEEAVRIKEGGNVTVDEVVAVSMGPESADRAIRKAISLGVDRAVHLCDEAVTGSDVAATGLALAKTLERESPDLVLLGQQSDDGGCYTIGAVVADHLRMPSLTQVIKMDVAGRPPPPPRPAADGPDTAQGAPPPALSPRRPLTHPRPPPPHAAPGAQEQTPPAP